MAEVKLYIELCASVCILVSAIWYIELNYLHSQVDNAISHRPKIRRFDRNGAGNKAKSRHLAILDKSSSYEQNETLESASGGQFADRHFVGKNLTVRATGRLGSQLFQFAAFVAAANANEMNAVYTWRHDDLSDWFMLKDRPSLDLNDDYTGYSFFGEKGCMGHVDDRIFNLSKHVSPDAAAVVLNGCYQSFKYFVDYEQQIRSEFRFRPEVISSARDKMEEQHPGLLSDNVTVVGLHIRRGDFGRPHSLKMGRTMAETEYYSKAIQYFLSKYKNVTFVTSRLTKEWAESQLSSLGHLVFIEHTSPTEDLYILSSCDHVIISSGLFSWWVGWMNSGDVVYFDRYPLPGSLLARNFDAADYYPSHWIPMH